MKSINPKERGHIKSEDVAIYNIGMAILYSSIVGPETLSSDNKSSRIR